MFPVDDNTSSFPVTGESYGSLLLKQMKCTTSDEKCVVLNTFKRMDNTNHTKYVNPDNLYNNGWSNDHMDLGENFLNSVSMYAV